MSGRGNRNRRAHGSIEIHVFCPDSTKEVRSRATASIQVCGAVGIEYIDGQSRRCTFYLKISCTRCKYIEVFYVCESRSSATRGAAGKCGASHVRDGSIASKICIQRLRIANAVARKIKVNLAIC